MNGQMNLFANDAFSVIEGISTKDDELLKCFKSELQSVEYMTLKDLFSGFNMIKAITFSYDIGFINELMEHFDYGEVILGGNFLVQKDGKLNDLLAEVLTNAYEAGKAIQKYDKLANMLTDGDIEFKTPSFVLDHRKIYLLKSDNGRTRVIKSSANLSKKAWNNDHIEHYEYDDSKECYEAYVKDFETAWDISQAITMDVISSKKTDNLVEENVILKGIKETGHAIVLQQPEGDISFDNIKYTIDHGAIKEKYQALLGDVKPKSKTGLFEIVPKTLEKMEYNQKKLLQKKMKTRNITERYPSLTLDLYHGEAFLNGKQLHLNPTDEEVKHDINEIIGIFHNFEQFVSSDIEKLKYTHYKLMNAIFCSPFHAKFRCASKIKGVSTDSLPLFALISSETSNSGKTFMIKAALKLMTGKELDGTKACDYSKDNIKETQLAVKGVPFFIDEIDNLYISRIKDIIKNPEKCEENQLEDMPMILFASNDVLKPDEPLRKRMIFFAMDGALPSTIDKTAYASRGKSIIRKLGTGFYREYLSKMMDKAKEELDFIIYSKEFPDDYYPKLLALSSEVIISIFEDYGYTLPSYIRKLTWNDDYSMDSNAGEIVHEIASFCKNNKKAYKLTKDRLLIECGIDKDSQRKINSWKNLLPAEMKAEILFTREYCKISIDRKVFEKRCGHKLSKFSLFGKE